jgi:hypothetical protein
VVVFSSVLVVVAPSAVGFVLIFDAASWVTNSAVRGVVGNAEALVVAVGAVDVVNEPSEEKVYYYTILVAVWQNCVLFIVYLLPSLVCSGQLGKYNRSVGLYNKELLLW